MCCITILGQTVVRIKYLIWQNGVYINVLWIVSLYHVTLWQMFIGAIDFSIIKWANKAEVMHTFFNWNESYSRWFQFFILVGFLVLKFQPSLITKSDMKFCVLKQIICIGKYTFYLRTLCKWHFFRWKNITQYTSDAIY